MTSVHDLSDEELRAELERTRDAYSEYVRDVGEHPSHSTRDLDDGARLHLEVREELDRRHIGHHDAPLRWDAGGQAGAGHVDPGERVAARQASYTDEADGGSDAESESGGGTGSEAERSTSGQPAGGGEPGERHADLEDLPDKLDPGEIEPYA